MKHPGALVSFLMAGLAVVGGCEEQPLATAAVELRIVDRAAYEQVIKKLAGKVLLVDYWATWCAPCVEQFPHTVELSKRFRDRGLAVVSLSLDDPDEKAKVLAFLEARGATFDNLISKFGIGTRSMEEFDLRGDVPFYRLYDRAGKLRYQFSAEPEGLANGEPLERIDGRVEELLGE